MINCRQSDRLAASRPLLEHNVLLGGCGGLHSRVWCLPHSSVVGLCRVGEWASDAEERGPGIAGWLIMVAETDQGR